MAPYLSSKGAKTGSLNLNSNLISAAAAGDIKEITMGFEQQLVIMRANKQGSVIRQPDPDINWGPM